MCKNMTEIEKIKLQDLIESESGTNWWDKELFIKKILHLLPKELKILELPPIYKNNYNCFVYALGLNKDSYFLGAENPVYQEFVKYLIENNILKLKVNPKPGDLAVWLTFNGEYSHAGIIKDSNKIISKWMWGPIIENDINDFPLSFGKDIIYIEKPYAKIIKNEYMKYKNSGVYIPSMK